MWLSRTAAANGHREDDAVIDTRELAVTHEHPAVPQEDAKERRICRRYGRGVCHAHQEDESRQRFHCGGAVALYSPMRRQPGSESPRRAPLWKSCGRLVQNLWSGCGGKIFFRPFCEQITVARPVHVAFVPGFA
jgi:hypothetical protein